ncbi:hypothetical protein CC80DRAFT_289757 [Byssothecium circinans]|uniref:Uncharacterized protein n=1 Tax=Byssothecium circinans TaxID=147558 RepID=A0A6A5U5Y7_9PLEO|nr:hypothetical protein CC80DRAFT_289757 [Byssothecium circinans]
MKHIFVPGTPSSASLTNLLPPMLVAGLGHSSTARESVIFASQSINTNHTVLTLGLKLVRERRGFALVRICDLAFGRESHSCARRYCGERS